MVFANSIAFATEPLAIPDSYDIEYPEDEPPQEREVLLGKVLFFDTLLSGNKTMSCATCHNPELGFGDGLKHSFGANGRQLKRHTPHLYNLAWASSLFWDGRAETLEQQSLMPIANPDEMDLNLEELITRIKANKWYRDEFSAVYGEEGISLWSISSGLASFMRSIVVKNSPFDKYLAGDTAALSEKQLRGKVVFEGKAKCTSCHDGANLTDDSFHSLGVATNDKVRGEHLKDNSMNFRVKTPGLRNVALTAPYMHDGSQPTLQSVIKFYNEGGGKGPNLDPLIKPLELNEKEVSDLLAFLHALTDPIEFSRPENIIEKE